ncbi:hypothetical protein JCM5350_008350 [Sporobolomyces pararoseus]
MLLEPFLLLALCLLLFHYWNPPPPYKKAPLPPSHHLAKKIVKHKHTIKRKGWPKRWVRIEGIISVKK